MSNLDNLREAIAELSAAGALSGFDRNRLDGVVSALVGELSGVGFGRRLTLVLLDALEAANDRAAESLKRCAALEAASKGQARAVEAMRADVYAADMRAQQARAEKADVERALDDRRKAIVTIETGLELVNNQLASALAERDAADKQSDALAAELASEKIKAAALRKELEETQATLKRERELRAIANATTGRPPVAGATVIGAGELLDIISADGTVMSRTGADIANTFAISARLSKENGTLWGKYTKAVAERAEVSEALGKAETALAAAAFVGDNVYVRVPREDGAIVEATIVALKRLSRSDSSEGAQQ